MRSAEVATSKPDPLIDFPFLRAALEDLQAAQRYASTDQPNRRHVICLLFDALEFIFYEILLLHEKDIYKSGQNTIGFDDALDACRKIPIEIPLIGTVRAVQKHRGDAKHHAQSPEDNAYDLVQRNLPIVISRLIYEQFEPILGDVPSRLPIIRHHVALFTSYRRRRNVDWPKALELALGALLQKHREMFGKSGTLAFPSPLETNILLRTIESDINKTNYTAAPPRALDTITTLSEEVRKIIKEQDWRSAAEFVGNAYSIIDQLVPGLFDIAQATKMTDNLYLPRSLIIRGAMIWGKVFGRAGSDEEKLTNEIAIYLKEHPALVRKFGATQYMEEDDRYWKWWEFAIFDGYRWHSFRLDHRFEISLEFNVDPKRDTPSSVSMLQRILTELQRVPE
jgi:hypothetical protein